MGLLLVMDEDTLRVFLGYGVFSRVSIKRYPEPISNSFEWSFLSDSSALFLILKMLLLNRVSDAPAS